MVINVASGLVRCATCVLCLTGTRPTTLRVARYTSARHQPHSPKHSEQEQSGSPSPIRALSSPLSFNRIFGEELLELVESFLVRFTGVVRHGAPLDST